MTIQLHERLVLILALLLPMMAGAQELRYDLRGTILDSDNGEPVVGACITICGTHQGTISDYDGCFHFETEPDGICVTEGDQLVISHVGYRPQLFSLDCLRPTIYLDRDTITICRLSSSIMGVVSQQQTFLMECGYTYEYRQDSNGRQVMYEKPREVNIEMTPRIPIRRDSIITETVRMETRQQNQRDSLRTDSICRRLKEKYPDVDPEESTGPEPFMVSEQNPEFKGGNEMLYGYLAKSLSAIRWPRKAGLVRITFAVEKDGKISQIKTTGKLPKKTNAAIVRMMEAMPVWVPGKQFGKPVSTVCAIEIE